MRNHSIISTRRFRQKRVWYVAACAVVALTFAGAVPSVASAAVASTADIEDSEPDALTLNTSEGTSIEIEVPADTTSPVASSAGTGDLADLVGGDVDVAVPAEVQEAIKEFAPAEKAAVSPGAVMPFSVIGADSRYQVANVTSSPYVQTPFIYYSRGGSNYLCTGWLVGPYAIATAGHCLYQDGQYSTNIQVYFGFSGTSAVAGCLTDHVSIPSQWTSGYAHEHDWGVVQLNCNAGRVFGYYGYKVPVEGPGGSDYRVTGYPADKASGGGYTMWQDVGPVVAVTANKLWYAMDTAGGQSGGPVWRPETGTSCGNCVVGIHAYGVGLGGPYGSYNSATRITSSTFATLNVYRSGWVSAA